MGLLLGHLQDRNTSNRPFQYVYAWMHPEDAAQLVAKKTSQLLASLGVNFDSLAGSPEAVMAQQANLPHWISVEVHQAGLKVVDSFSVESFNKQDGQGERHSFTSDSTPSEHASELPVESF